MINLRDTNEQKWTWEDNKNMIVYYFKTNNNKTDIVERRET